MADNLNFNYGISANLANAGMTAGTTSTITTTAATSAVLNGKFVTPLAPQTNAATPVLDAATGLAFVPMLANQCCSLVFGVTQAGVLQMAQGKIIATNAGAGAVAGSLLNEPQFPGLPNNFVPLAYTVVQTAPSAAPWTPGAGAWAASGVTATAFQNVSQLPNRPQAS